MLNFKVWLFNRCTFHPDVPLSTSESSLQKEFSKFGQIAEGTFDTSLNIYYPSLFSTLIKLKSALSLFMVSSILPPAVKLVKDEATKKSKGFAFIQYASQEDAMLALESMDHEVLYAYFCFL